MIKYSELLATWLKELGYTHCFFVAGGGCMHLIDGFRHHFKMAAVVHEMSAGVAAEHFNECSTDGKAFALVTSGPGFTNIVTAVAGCYTERRPLLVIAGQVKSTDLITGRLRQRGMQEIDGSAITAPITVHSRCLRKPLCRADLRAIAEAAYHPHPGPVVIEVCLDVQGCQVDPVELNAAPQSPDTHFEDSSLLGGEDARTQARWLAGHLSGAKRPLLLLGGQVSREVAWRLLPILEQAGVPVMTTTSAMDRVPCDSPVWAGRPNSWGGQRCANLLVGQADVIVGVGVQWDLQQTGFNWQEYAPCAKLYQVYPSVEELGKGHPVLAGAVAAVPDEILPSLAQALDWTDREDWRGYIRRAQALVPTLEPANVAREGYHSNYAFLQKLTRALRAEDVIAMTSSGNCFTGRSKSPS
ncbi:MAG: thiamine pyrophosphate-binding protein [Verrucomicrobiaceae bacterium]|nr:thiamine pyrophosphate-binding protein [Verrucomicrobiaceae bacterium]